MTSITDLSQSPVLDAEIMLFRLDTTLVGGTVLYFCKGALAGERVSFGGQDYIAIDIEVSDFETNAGGVLPQPTMRIANSDDQIQTLVNTYGDLVGCEIRRVRTFKRFLDGQAEEDPTAFIGPDVFRVERKKEENPSFVEWELSAAIDQEGKMLPGEPILRDTCHLRYRRYDPSDAKAAPDGFVYSSVNPCPYTGTACFSRLNEPTTAANDACSYSYTGCKLRFGEDQPSPFGGFLGVARVRT